MKIKTTETPEVVEEVEETLETPVTFGLTRLVGSSDEPHIIINDDRSIVVPDELKNIAVQFDHNIETVTFDCPRYWDNHDFSTMHIYVVYLCSDKSVGRFLCTNVVVDDADPDKIHFDWTISQNVTKVSGKISFIVCIKEPHEDGTIVRHWNSVVCQDMNIVAIPTELEQPGDDIVIEPDLIEQILLRIEDLERDGGSGGSVTAESNVFIVDRETTTWQEVEDAKSAGKLCVMFNASLTYVLVADGGVGSSHNFYAIGRPNTLKWLKLNTDNTWTPTFNNLVTEQYMTKFITQYSGDNEIPTAKAVYTALENLKQNGTGCLLTVETITIGDDGEPETVPVTGITLDYTSISLNAGESMMLAASVLPSNATNNIVLWKSNNTGIATVDNGFVTAVAGGNTVITAYSAEDDTVKATCSVAVAAESGGGSGTTDGKVMFASLTPVKSGAILKNDGITEYVNSQCHGYYSLPYSEGIQISTCTRYGWVDAYPPVIVVDASGTVTKPEYTDNGMIDGTVLNNYVITLSGLSEDVTVYANVADSTNKMDKIMELCYYIPGGAE